MSGITGPRFDTDALAFINATGLNDSTQKYAINILVKDMKRNGLWSKMKAIYPMVGGTATTHKFNLKDPRDLDAAFRLQFFNGWIHSTGGVLPNGVDTYAKTFFISGNELSDYNTAMSIYLRTNSDLLGFDMGWFDDVEQKGQTLYARYNNNVISDTGVYTTSRITTANTDSRGMYTVTRIANNNFRLFKNGVQIGSNTTIDNSTLNSTLPDRQILISAVHLANIYQQFSNRQVAFASISDGLSPTDSANLYNIVQNFNTLLNRNI